ncbi:glutamate--tRNA ligase [Chitinivibrio alkaliphilus]|uniref:Glutamate--tRNA ligase n=1 Tax=Chitinivibrio alkaliphilus ACht1 TaxID=1313304 RepID=U7D7U9_9BACT|nr:glutamate--tRNA ligase [Chitinivibrio alkaliphilus]ERP32013.1 glutamyl-tRNA synthetase [Chitinivibrio alkaliphilus ACht1]
MTVRVRFAPSPTGYLHVGGARTALFNYLFAKKMQGSFIVRIEDTDQSRYQEDALTEIFTSLTWLGLEWDEGPEKGGSYGPYYQSQRLELYETYTQELLESGVAYHCFCSAERLASLRAKQEADHRPSGYDRHCRHISLEEANKRRAAGETSVVRLRIPDDETIHFVDEIRGEISFTTNELDDFVLMKTDGYPTYHLANVVDDHAMEISHVLRGDEWINSTPKHELLYRSFGWAPPKWVHLPIILAESGGKLSKRKGAASVMDYCRRGILPEALFNFLALLGWSPGDDRELLDTAEMASLFSFSGISPKGSVFDTTKLEWMNGQYLAHASAERLVEEVTPFIDETVAQFPPLMEAVGLLKSRCKTLQELGEALQLLCHDPQEYPDTKKVVKALKKNGVEALFSDMIDLVSECREFAAPVLEEAFSRYLSEKELGFGRVGLPVRIALTGQAGGPSLFELMEILGKETVIRRLTRCRKYVLQNYSEAEK